MVSDTIIEWNEVSMRNKSNLPLEHKRIVYWYEGIGIGYVSVVKDKLCVISPASRSTVIKTGFLWCYESNIQVPSII